jgi:DNA repair protein RecN (Recombination protein N)
MSEVGENLVHVHGQAEQQRLREEAWQRSLVDRFGGVSIDQALGEFRSERIAWRGAQERLELWRADRDRAAQMQHQWARGLAEIDAADPREDELTELDALAAVLGNAESLTEHAREAAQAIAAEEGGGVDALSILNGVIRQLEAIAALDSRKLPLLERARSVAAELADLRTEISSYERSVESDPQRYAQVEERRRLLSALMKAYGPELSDVLAWAERARTGLAELTDETGAELAEAEAHARAAMITAAGKLSALRSEAAAGLTQAVGQELAALALPDAELNIEVKSSDQADVMRGHGADQIAINFRAHPDAPWRPLAKAASGGELSRLALAIEVVLVAGEQQPTLIFDEVDAGIGGAVAVEVGRRLARLATHAQVIVVTHLPQVAAFADTHLVVERAKDRSSGRFTHVTEVHGEQRVTELVRMLSGLSDSDAGAAHARELLGVAGKSI